MQPLPQIAGIDLNVTELLGQQIRQVELADESGGLHHFDVAESGFFRLRFPDIRSYPVQVAISTLDGGRFSTIIETGPAVPVIVATWLSNESIMQWDAGDHQTTLGGLWAAPGQVPYIR